MADENGERPTVEMRGAVAAAALMSTRGGTSVRVPVALWDEVVRCAVALPDVGRAPAVAADGDPQGASGPTLSPDDLARVASIRERVEKATKGPWTPERRQEDGWNQADWLVVFPDGEDASVLNEADSDFIAHAREDIPWLLARLTPTTLGR